MKKGYTAVTGLAGGIVLFLSPFWLISLAGMRYMNYYPHLYKDIVAYRAVASLIMLALWIWGVISWRICIRSAPNKKWRTALVLAGLTIGSVILCGLVCMQWGLIWALISIFAGEAVMP